MKSLLIANRGEIAVRVIRAAKEMNIRTIAIYSELDRDALHVKLADEAWNIGPAPAADSYLDMDRILTAARESEAEGVHPGYGFLAENGEFAQKVIDAGLTWVGPSPESMRTMGDKVASRRALAGTSVPLVPGTDDPLESADDLKAIAKEFGFPIAIKASAGGGGKGLRVVHSVDELLEGYDGARREAQAYFGSSVVYVEKYLLEPRHIEAQILADDHGRIVFLGERDCSVQRRHQKLIEETPSPRLRARQRRALGKAAIAVAKACDYRGAGTVEFLLDKEGDFFFLEMNTRLQVEHTITEMVTGIDLVREQILIAQGKPISFKEVETNGHAMEFRINAEDPSKGFLPAPGTVIDYREPTGLGVRVDSWIEPSTTVSQYYDNLMGKLIVWAPTRKLAIARGIRCLEEFVISGVKTTIPAHLAVLRHSDFLKDKHHTKWLEEEVDLSGADFEVGVPLPTDEERAQRAMTVEVGGRRFDVTFWAPPVRRVGGEAPRRKAPKLKSGGGPSTGGDGIITSPMQGTIVKVSVSAGDAVETGDNICVLEAMKMENAISSPTAGEVIDLRVQPGDTVNIGDIIAIVK